MKEVVTIQVGQCGNQVAWRFWDLAAHEHNLAPADVGAGSTFFRPAPKDDESALGGWPPFINRRKARAVIVDMEEGVIAQLMRSSLRSLFDTTQTVADVSGAGNNWAHGFCVYGPQYTESILDRVRRELEFCDSPQSFLLLHSLGGGTGSGLGSYIMEQLADTYPELYRFSTALLPSRTDDVVTSPYNTVLSLSKLIEHADCVLPVENEALAAMSTLVKTMAKKTAPAPGASSPCSNICQVPSSASSASRGGGAGSGTGAASATAAAAAAADIPSPLTDSLSQATAVLQQADAELGAARGSKPSSAGASRLPTSGGRGRPVAAAPAAPAARAVGRGAAATAKVSSSAPGSSASTSAATAAAAEPSVVATKRTGTAFDELNNIVAHMLTHLTASMRFPGALNVDLNEITSTLVPFPRMHFLSSSLNPLVSSAPSAESLINDALSRSQMLVDGDIRRGTHMACALLMRGDIPLSEAVRGVSRLQRDLRMVPWNPDGFKVGLCGTPSLVAPRSVLCLSNNSSIAQPLTHVYNNFLRLYRVRAHVHHYTELMDPSLLYDAAVNVTEVAQQYTALGTGGGGR